jgi:hypothetical protein
VSAFPLPPPLMCYENRPVWQIMLAKAVSRGGSVGPFTN